MNRQCLGLRKPVDFSPLDQRWATVQARRDYMLNYMTKRREAARRERIARLLILMDGCWPPGASIDRIFFGPDGARPAKGLCLFCGMPGLPVCGSCRYESRLKDQEVVA